VQKFRNAEKLFSVCFKKIAQSQKYFWERSICGSVLTLKALSAPAETRAFLRGLKKTSAMASAGRRRANL